MGNTNELLIKWGVENNVFQRWKNDDLINILLRKGNLIINKRKTSLSQVNHPVEVELQLTNPIQHLYEPNRTPEDWMSYSYKWFGDGGSEWSYIHTDPTNEITITRENPNAASAVPYLPYNKPLQPISRVSDLV